MTRTKSVYDPDNPPPRGTPLGDMHWAGKCALNDLTEFFLYLQDLQEIIDLVREDKENSE